MKVNIAGEMASVSHPRTVALIEQHLGSFAMIRSVSLSLRQNRRAPAGLGVEWTAEIDLRRRPKIIVSQAGSDISEALASLVPRLVRRVRREIQLKQLSC